MLDQIWQSATDVGDRFVAAFLDLMLGPTPRPHAD